VSPAAALPFRDRHEAGRHLALRLLPHANRRHTTVLALPRGGVPVAYEVAVVLQVPLDVFLVRKLGVPGHPELAMGAIASGGIRVINDRIVRELGVTQADLDRVAAMQAIEIARQETAFRGEQPPLNLAGRTVVLVDDGLATGASMRAAAEAVRAQHPARVIVAVPVAARETYEEFQRLVDEVACVATPEPFHAVGMWYEDFSQTSDEEVRSLLDRGARSQRTSRST